MKSNKEDAVTKKSALHKVKGLQVPASLKKTFLEFYAGIKN